MSAVIMQNEIDAALRRIHKRFGIVMNVNRHAGGLRATTFDEGRDISPRLGRRDMLAWLLAFECGAEELQTQQEKQ